MSAIERVRGRRGCARLACVVLWTALNSTQAGELSHADGIEALRERMRRMDALVFERTLTPLAVDRERMRRADEIAALAGELAAAATALATASNDAIPDEARRALFLDNARRLGTEAATLGRIAEERRLSEVAPQIERIGHACAACHAEFRPSSHEAQ